MSLRNRSEFRLPEKLPEVLPLIKSHPERQWDDVLRQVTVYRLNLPEESVGAIQCFFKLRAKAGALDFLRRAIAVKGGEVLPFLGHHPVAMQIPVRTNIHNDLKTQICIFESSSHLLPTCGSFPEVSF